MNKLNLTWSPLLLFIQSSLNQIDSGAGVYRLSYKSADGSYYVFYVGKADKSLKEDLVSVLLNTSNPCLKTHLSNLECYFRYAVVADKEERKNIEKTLYDHFGGPKCNLEIPLGEKVSVNTN